jgi:hypothetical protein
MQLDFLEIGTSDFSTELQKCNSNAVGMSIDAIQYYLDRLPTKPNVIKVCCAVSNEDGEAQIYYIPDTVINQLELPFWVRGCNSINKQHPTVAQLLQKRSIDAETVYKIDIIPKLSIRSLFEKYGITSISYFKVDTEGHDCIIMRAFADELRAKRLPPPKNICFETNVLSDKTEQQEIIQIFCSEFGYRVTSSGDDTILQHE